MSETEHLNDLGISREAQNIMHIIYFCHRYHSWGKCHGPENKRAECSVKKLAVGKTTIIYLKSKRGNVNETK
jgi:hypothetical protein